MPDPVPPLVAPRIGLHMIGKQLKLEGFNVHRWHGRWQEAFLPMDEWIKEVCATVSGMYCL